MLTLLTFPPFFAEPSSSPFCTKAMILLTMAGRDWQPDFNPDLATLPHGKLPVLRDGETIIPDSNGILRWLEAEGANLFPGLNALERVHAHAVIRMIEENLRMGLVHDRWLDETTWAVLKPTFFASVPEAHREAMASKIREGIRQWASGHGVARVSDAERLSFFASDLEALTTLLSANTWMFGDQPTAVDAIAVPMLSSIESLPEPTPLREAVRANAALMAYIEQGRATLYPLVTEAIASIGAAA